MCYAPYSKNLYVRSRVFLISIILTNTPMIVISISIKNNYTTEGMQKYIYGQEGETSPLAFMHDELAALPVET